MERLSKDCFVDTSHNYQTIDFIELPPFRTHFEAGFFFAQVSGLGGILGVIFYRHTTQYFNAWDCKCDFCKICTIHHLYHIQQKSISITNFLVILTLFIFPHFQIHTCSKLEFDTLFSY